MIVVTRSLLRAAALLTCALSSNASLAAAEPVATLIRNVVILDGSGAPSYPGALRIADGRIVEVGRALQARPGEQVHDGNGQVLAPGFIDTHSHHERGLFKKRSGDELLSQGVTTIVVGQDGSSELPIGKLWRTLEQAPVAVNVASYTGHNTLRSTVIGKNYRRVSTPQEITKMAELLAADMRDGSLGLSSGLGYDPGIYADIAEVVELGKATAPYGGRYISHIRNENVTLWKSIDELLRVGREARIPVQLSHAKLSMVSLWGQAPKLLAMLDAARAEGIDATLDIYPYEYWQSTMTVALPERDFNDVTAARWVLANTIKPDGIRFTTYDADRSIVGKTLAQVAAERKADPAELYLQLIRDAKAKGAKETIIGTSMSGADIATLMRWSHANICSDGETNGSHPRGAGSYARVLGKYVREDRVLTLASAVNKMSGMAADHMGFKDRGYLRPGLVADLVLFDPATIQDRATVATPNRLATGVSQVWVNGEVTWSAGRPTGKYPGRALRRAARE
ncbi:N-acyl-D-amino-acid deacylase family protein [Peristeroidobacter soli]|jgi:N-acyl-D-amino-acid deacylase|uniref:N-acyl-D-amino-acid deacylase family protein n=1 Tax=Peristeroidobacter soli TaxID=2497877 RepID=UPI00101B7500|nr:amidohydrolase family protein [Peristeroidobacter soli]